MLAPQPFGEWGLSVRAAWTCSACHRCEHKEGKGDAVLFSIVSPYLEIVCEYLLKEHVGGIALCCKYRAVDYLLSKMHMTSDFSVYSGPVLSLCQGEAKAVAPWLSGSPRRSAEVGQTQPGDWPRGPSWLWYAPFNSRDVPIFISKSLQEFTLFPCRNQFANSLSQGLYKDADLVRKV